MVSDFPMPQFAAGPPLVMIGASVRAAAWSALRAGFAPLCVDQFGDRDLAAVAPVIRVDSDPAELLAAVAQYPPAPLMYTGGLENHPELIARLSADRPLWGMGADVLRGVRDPVAVAAALAGLRLPVLEVRDASQPPPPDGAWLLKPLRSGGGRGIVPWISAARQSPTLREPHYFQRRFEGASYSAVFIAGEGIGDVRFVGLTEQLIGEPELGGRPFVWCGNIGPVALDVPVEMGIRRIANVLKRIFTLRGLFGIDFVADSSGRYAMTELNPRYPASLELLEFATGTALLRDHVECFAPEALPEFVPEWQPETGGVLGKGVVYRSAEDAGESPGAVTPGDFHRWPDVADIPQALSAVPHGAPFLTVYESGATTDDCRSRIRERARSLRARLNAVPPRAGQTPA